MEKIAMTTQTHKHICKHQLVQNMSTCEKSKECKKKKNVQESNPIPTESIEKSP